MPRALNLSDIQRAYGKRTVACRRQGVPGKTGVVGQMSPGVQVQIQHVFQGTGGFVVARLVVFAMVLVVGCVSILLGILTAKMMMTGGQLDRCLAMLSGVGGVQRVFQGGMLGKLEVGRRRCRVVEGG